MTDWDEVSSPTRHALLGCGEEVRSMTTTNEQFAQKVGIHHSMASRIRSGDRLPSLPVIDRISKEYGIGMSTLVAARLQGSEAFSALVRRRIFGERDTPAEVDPVATGA